MLLQQLFENISPGFFLAICATGLVAHLLYNKFCTGLNHIPGPFWASFTDFYRLYVVWHRRPEQWHIQLHRQHGAFVRIGPRTVICSDNKATKTIYALNSGFVKVLLIPLSVAMADQSYKVKLLPGATSFGERGSAKDLVYFNRRSLSCQIAASGQQCLCDEFVGAVRTTC
jgi:hypothetical protein